MTIKERAVGSVMILDIQGRITVEVAGVLRDKALSLLEQGSRLFVLNLQGVAYIDSAGLGELVSIYASVRRHGGRVNLLHLTRRVKDVLTITKLSTVFDVYDLEADAIRSIAGGAGV